MRCKKFITIALAATFTAAFSLTAFAGQWQSDPSGRRWINDDGTYPTNTWKWLDGDQDGISERYYFDRYGYRLVKTTAPDGSTLNDSGAWTVDGVVQTRQISDIDSFGYTEKFNNLIWDLMDHTKAENDQKYGTPERSGNGYTYPSCPYIEVLYGMPDEDLSAQLGYSTDTDYPHIISVKSSALPFNKIFTDAPAITDSTSLDAIVSHLSSLGYTVIDSHALLESENKMPSIQLGRFDVAFDQLGVFDDARFAMRIRQDKTEEASQALNDIFNLSTATGGSAS